MKNTLQVTENAVVSMTSLEIVEFINSRRPEGSAELRHDNFMAKVPQVLGEIGALNFKGTYFDTQNKERPCYRFPKRESMLMAMSYDYAAQAAIYDRWQELETQVQQLESKKLKQLEDRNYLLIHDLSDNISHIASSMNAIKAAEKEVKLIKTRMADYIDERVTDLREVAYDLREAGEIGLAKELISVVRAMLRDLKGVTNPKNEALTAWCFVSESGLDRYARERVALMDRYAQLEQLEQVENS